MSFSRVSCRAQLSAVTSSLVSSFIATICRNERKAIPIVIFKTLVQLPFVCMDGLTLFFMAMLNLAGQGGKSNSFTVYRFCPQLPHPPIIQRLDITQLQERAETR